MPISDSKRRADTKWRMNNLEQIAIRVRKGTRDTWKQQALIRGMSLASLIQTAVTEYLERHPAPADQEGSAQS